MIYHKLRALLDGLQKTKASSQGEFISQIELDIDYLTDLILELQQEYDIQKTFNIETPLIRIDEILGGI